MDEPSGIVVATGRVVSVNVGRSRTSSWRGATVESAIAKAPAAGRVAVRGVNLDGDAQADRAVHGGARKAVYAYPVRHYAWWERRFGVPASAWGFLGENLTVDGLDESDVAFGDVLCVGSMRLLVTEPRGPCYKLAMRVGADAAPVLMLQEGRTGFYLGVIEEGDVGPGDQLSVIDGAVHPRVTIAELCAAFAHPAAVDAERLEQLARLPGLDAAWRDHFEHEPDRRRRPCGAPARRDLVVARRTDVAADVVMLELEPADGVSLGRHEAGQFIPLVVELDGEEQVRCYSLLDAPSDGRRRIAVRRSRENGRGASVSRHLHATASAGTRLTARDPAGAFTLAGIPPDASVTLIAGGIGITPLLAIARVLAAGGRSFRLLFGVRDATELLFAEELGVLAGAPNCSGVLVCYPGASDAGERIQCIDAGAITDDAIRDGAKRDDYFFVCGPAPMQDAVVAALSRWGVAASHIRLESFAGRMPAAATDAAPQEVVFDRRARVVLWADGASSLLDLAEEHGIEIPYSCRSGSCGTCAVKILEGAVAYTRAPSAPVAPGTCLACISYPTEPTVLDA